MATEWDQLPLSAEGTGAKSIDLGAMVDAGVVQGDALALLPRLEAGSVDLFFMSPPYADQRAYSRIHPDRYVEWFLPFAQAMYDATRVR